MNEKGNEKCVLIVAVKWCYYEKTGHKTEQN